MDEKEDTTSENSDHTVEDNNSTNEDSDFNLDVAVEVATRTPKVRKDLAGDNSDEDFNMDNDIKEKTKKESYSSTGAKEGEKRKRGRPRKSSASISVDDKGKNKVDCSSSKKKNYKADDHQQKSARKSNYMGFGGFIGMKIHDLLGCLGYYVISEFDVEEMKLPTSNGAIKVTEDKVHEILGIPNGGMSIDSLEERKQDDPFIKEWFQQFLSGKKDVRPNDITDVIVGSNDYGKLFRMNFLMLFANTMGMCDAQGACSMKILNRINDNVIERVQSINWCKFIIDCLEPSLKRWKGKKSKYYTGPQTFMTLLYLDSTRCDAFPVPRQRPTIREWKTILMKFREKIEIESGGFGLLPKEDDVCINSLQSKDFVEKIQTSFNNINLEMGSISSSLKEGLSRFPLCDNLKQLLEEFKKGISSNAFMEEGDACDDVDDLAEDDTSKNSDESQENDNSFEIYHHKQSVNQETSKQKEIREKTDGDPGTSKEKDFPDKEMDDTIEKNQNNTSVVQENKDANLPESHCAKGKKIAKSSSQDKENIHPIVPADTIVFSPPDHDVVSEDVNEQMPTVMRVQSLFRKQRNRDDQQWKRERDRRENSTFASS
ncbi:hypothetical protein CTI12_AA461980 [Artemisia annua]|uniref:Ulp1 protease family, C-terminal catalytic domain-containing protein n=1 Tax=Artemisia annua TaxID=35608 RepID=A0A2U1LRQ7_ARTAN|nr:hypothetical protein CTI12_AA461980 [Artemisia annua]